eukprot:TRINITY_DN4227_c0_g2_i1.p1 TRINITY_DN4227_c0_g2~~TRINITY_DN4227_c0_g2_i1.p1  ORF type:complete len:227 (+),score=37.94 TRINITY_DN4227_c0_g2_i1:70-681(+)
MSLANYGSVDYWDDRFEQDTEPFDWYQQYDDLQELINNTVDKSANVLVVGCGNSNFSEDMYEDGYKSITNIDISSVVISQMASRCSEQSGMLFTPMNVQKMSFKTGEFDAVIDKACLDSVLCSENSSKSGDKMLKEVSRVLKSGGVYLCVSYANPGLRQATLEKSKYHWTVDVQTIDKPTAEGVTHEDPEAEPVHYIYTMTKE